MTTPEDTTTVTGDDVSEQGNDENFNAGFDEQKPDTGVDADKKNQDEGKKDIKTPDAGKTDEKKGVQGKEDESGENASETKETETQENLEAEAANEVFWAEVEGVFPGARKLASTPEFRTWAESLPSTLRALTSSLDKADAVYLLKMYAESQTKKSEGGSSATQVADDPYGLKGFKFKHGDTEIDMEDFRKEYGDVPSGMVAIAERIAEKKFAELLAKANVGGKDVQQKLNDLVFWDAVRDSHPDAKKVIKEQAYKDWLSKAAPTIKKLADSNDAEHLVYVLDRYKEETVQTVVKGAKDKARGQKEKIDAVHFESLRDERQDKGSSGTKDDKQDFEAGFEGK